MQINSLPISFASDNHAGIHPDIMQALQAANSGYALAYGKDVITKEARTICKELFGECEVFFVLTGTAANTLALSTMLQPYQAVIAPETAHINTFECGATEKFVGSKILTVPSSDGKITIDQIKHHLRTVGSIHHAKPRVVSITQATEYGTVYTPQELKEICNFAHEQNLLVHMDGNRLYNAAAYLGVSLKALTRDVGVDVLSLGGAKNGLMCGEAVIFFDPGLAAYFENRQQQAMQLCSKMRFVAVQLGTLLSNNLWLRNAQHANNMAQMLADGLAKIPAIKITQKVQANAVFVTMPAHLIKPLQQKFHFYMWNEQKSEVRLMTSWATNEKDVQEFLHEASK